MFWFVLGFFLTRAMTEATRVDPATSAQKQAAAVAIANANECARFQV